MLISYSWSEGFVCMKSLFNKEIEKKALTETHPELMAINDSLKNHRKTLDDIPKSIIELKLPVKVQTAPKSYDHDVLIKKLEGGNHLVTVRMTLTAFSTTMKHCKRGSCGMHTLFLITSRRKCLDRNSQLYFLPLRIL